MLPVYKVVGAHNGSGLPLPDGDFKGGKVKLPQGPLVQDAVGIEALVLLIVAGEVLQAGPHPVFLGGGNKGSGQLSGEEGVLAQVLEIPAAEGIALDINARAQHHADAEFLRFLRHGFPHPGRQLRVPAPGQRHGGGEAGGRPGRADPQHVVFPLLLAQAVGPVAKEYLRHAVLFHPLGPPEAPPRRQGNFFPQGHLFQNFLDFHLPLLLPFRKIPPPERDPVPFIVSHPGKKFPDNL